MKRLLAPLCLGVGATRHLIWYVSYQITRETRHEGGAVPVRRASGEGSVE
jgi:hypothetical protein